MKGLIIKDIISLKRQAKVLLLMLVFYIVFSISTDNVSMLGTMITLICAMMPITSMAYDEKCNWDKYGLSMPVSRKTVVLSKYVFGIVLDLIGIVAVAILSGIIVLFTHEMNITESLQMTVVIGAIALVFLALILPILFKFGVEKGRTMMLLVIFLPAGITMMLPKILMMFPKPIIDIPIEQILQILAYASPVLLIAILFISIKVSIGIYNKKEF